MEYMLMPLRRYADFSGRSRRMEYWMWYLFQMLLGFAFIILMLVVGGSAMFASVDNPGAAIAAGAGIMIVWLIALVVSLVLILPNIAVSVRRMHDINRSGWWIVSPWIGFPIAILGGALDSGAISLLAILVMIGFSITVLVFNFLEGTPGPNRFGPDPKGRGLTDTFA